MFHVHDKPVEAKPCHNPRRGNAGKTQPCPQRWLASFEFFFNLVGTHRSLIFLVLFVLRKDFFSSYYGTGQESDAKRTPFACGVIGDLLFSRFFRLLHFRVADLLQGVLSHSKTQGHFMARNEEEDG
jgi:hypothetical protein